MIPLQTTILGLLTWGRITGLENRPIHFCAGRFAYVRTVKPGRFVGPISRWGGIRPTRGGLHGENRWEKRSHADR